MSLGLVLTLQKLIISLGSLLILFMNHNVHISDTPPALYLPDTQCNGLTFETSSRPTIKSFLLGLFTIEQWLRQWLKAKGMKRKAQGQQQNKDLRKWVHRAKAWQLTYQHILGQPRMKTKIQWSLTFFCFSYSVSFYWNCVGECCYSVVLDKWPNTAGSYRPKT